MRNQIPGLVSLAGVCAAVGCGGSDLTLPSDHRASTLTIVTGNEQTASAGQALPLPLVVLATDASGGPVDQVRVAFVVTAGGGTTVPDTAVTGSDGRASTQWTLGPSAGAQSVEARVVGSDLTGATFLGTASSGAGSPALTTTRITSVNPSPSFPTQPVLVAFQVASAAGTPTGTVTVSDGTVSCTGSAPTAQCSLTLTTAGSTTLTALYQGSGNFAASSGSVEHQVMLAGTATQLSSSPNPSSRGQSVTFTATVTSSFGTPGGSVQLVEGSCDSPTMIWGTQTLNSAGVASFTTTALSGGTHLMLACYAGNAVFAPSSSNVLQQQVTKKGEG